MQMIIFFKFLNKFENYQIYNTYKHTKINLSFIIYLCFITFLNRLTYSVFVMIDPLECTLSLSLPL